MKKLIMILGLFLLVGGGCSLIGNFDKDVSVVDNDTSRIHYLDNELFSLDTPVVYRDVRAMDGGGGVLMAPYDENYPEILYYVKAGKVLSDVELLAQEKEQLKNLREQAEGDGEIVENKEVYFSEQKGNRTVIQYPGRSLEDSDGYIREFIYSFIINGNEFRFWTSTTDLENPDGIVTMFDGVMKTIQFK